MNTKLQISGEDSAFGGSELVGFTVSRYNIYIYLSCQKILMYNYMAGVHFLSFESEEDVSIK